MNSGKKSTFQLYFLIILLASIVAAWKLLLIPGESENSVLFGYSFSRIALFTVIVFVFLIAFWGLLKAVRNQNWLNNIINVLEEKRRWPSVLIFLNGLLSLGGYVFFLTPELEVRLSGYYSRLVPVVGLFTFIAISTLLVLLYRSADWSHLKIWQPFFKASIYPAIILLVLGLVVAWGKLGLTPDVVWWAAPGTPVMAYQVFVLWIMATAFIFLYPSLQNFVAGLNKFSGRLVLDGLLCVLIWLAAIWAWVPQPVISDHFITPFSPPNPEFYPFSDAATYDSSAQELLIGEGLSSESASKPAYSLFLGMLHAVAGQDYIHVANLQSALLGIIPVLMYLLTARLGGRPAGLIAAGIVVFRERNAIALTNVIEVSHSKMFMTDTPTFAFVLALVFLIIYWMEKPQQRTIMPLIVGGMLGLGVLLRGQILILIPITLFVSLILLWRRWSLWYRTSLLILVGGFLVLAPWLWRGFQESRQVSLSETLPRSYMLATKYSLTPTQRQAPLMGESAEAFEARMQKQFVQFVLEHPGAIVDFTSAHFFHNQVESVLYLPQSLMVESPKSYLKRVPFWNENWIGAFPSETGIALILNLGLIVLGLGASWKRNKARISIPIMVSIGYILVVSIARYSGWRFILPADWITNLFYSIGLAQLTLIGISVFLPGINLIEEVSSDNMVNVSVNKLSWKVFGLVGVGLLLIGSIFPIAENLFPRRYPSLTDQDALKMYETALLSDSNIVGPSSEALKVFLDKEGAQVSYGRGLYPRYLRSGRGFGGNSLVYNSAPYPRLVLQVIGFQGGLVELPLQSVPEFIPNTADVVVFGCREDAVIEALMVLVKKDGKTSLLIRSPWTELACPLSKP
jgi:hypothetical protein